MTNKIDKPEVVYVLSVGLRTEIERTQPGSVRSNFCLMDIIIEVDLMKSDPLNNNPYMVK
jgi:hypothetical protein